MPKLSLFVRLEAKPGKENEVAKFLEKAFELANQESRTLLWLALRFGPTTFGVFDAFADEEGRQNHLNGPIAKALMGSDLFVAPPSIERIDLLGVKLPR
jgi:quinol monooxygenase YgiN